VIVSRLSLKEKTSLEKIVAGIYLKFHPDFSLKRAYLIGIQQISLKFKFRGGNVMKKYLFLVISLALIMAIVLSGCRTKELGTIKIGFFAPLTGFAASDGESVLNSAKLAVETINNAGGLLGKKIELVDYDDNCNSDQAVSIAQKLIASDKVVAVVSGSYSNPTRAVAPIFQSAKIPMVSSYAEHPDITKAGDYIFRQSFVGSIQGRAGAEIAVRKIGAKKIAILQVDNDFGASLADSFREHAKDLGGEVISFDKFQIGEKEFNPLLTRIKKENPDLIYMVAYYEEGSQIMKQMKQLEMNTKVLGTEGIDSTKGFFEIVGKDAEGLVFTTNLNRDDSRKVTQDYIKNYTEKYGFAPDMVGASAYDSFMVLAEAIRISGQATSDAIKDGMYKIKDFDAVTGVISSYNKLGEVLKPVQVQTVKNGEIHFFDEITDTKVITPPDI